MTKRVTRLVVVWLLTAAGVTVWVVTQAPEVPANDAMLLGAVAATALSAVLVSGRRK